MFTHILRFLPSFSRSSTPPRRRGRVARFESLEGRQLLAGDLAITEFMASNAQTLADADGDFKDWIEIYNPSDQAVDLVGWSLTDDPDRLDKWQFPFQSAEAGAYLVVFASDKARAADSVSLTRDLNATADGTFLVDLASGVYDVRLTMGDRDRVRDNVTVSLQDTVVDTISTAAGEFAIRNYSVQVNAGQLRLRLQDNGGETARAAINALMITPAGGGEPQWFDFGQIDSPVEPRFTVVSELHAYQPGGRYGWQADATVISQDRGPADEPQLHTNFKLSAGGEYVALVSPDGQVVSEYGPGGTDYPTQKVDISYGLAPDGQVAFLEPTPGALNQAIALEAALPVQFSVPRGFYTEPFQLQLTAGTDGSVVRYTTDGSEPTEASGTVYQGPIAVSGTTTLRATAFKEGYAASAVTTHTYLFLADVVEQSPGSAVAAGFPSDSVNGQVLDYGLDPDIANDPVWGPDVLDALTTLPSLSLVTDTANLFDPQTGIYVNPGGRGRNWERAASLELLNPDGSVGFQTDTGIRIRGGFSRSGANPKHAFRLFFRDEYSGKLEFPLFGEEGVDRFKKIDLRTTQNYSWSFQGDRRNTFLRDIFSRDTQRDMGDPYTRGRYYHLYINGQYWGIYQTDERPEAAYAETYFGGDRVDYDVVKPNTDKTMEATDGNLDAYMRLYQASIEGFEDDDAYFRVQGMNPDGTRNPDYERLLDADNLINYMLITYYTGDRDGPASRYTNPKPNNFFGIYNRENPDGFKWFEHDSEHSLGTGDTNMISPLYTDRSGFNANAASIFNPHWLHEILMRNATYRDRFVDRLVQQTSPGGTLSESAALARLEYREGQIRDAIVAESARWGDAKRTDPLTANDWAAEVEWIKKWITTRNKVLFGQLRSAGWLSDVPLPLVDSSEPDDALAGEVSIKTPEGTSYFTTDGTDPRLANGQINPQARASNRIEMLVDETTSARYRIPTGAAAEDAWQAAGFDDSIWSAARGPIGFDTGGIEDVLSLPGGFTVEVAGSTDPVGSFAEAEALLAGADVEQFDGVPVIDFFTGELEGDFQGGQAFLGNGADYVALRASATVVVGRTGTYTFSLNSGGGSRLRIDGTELIVNEATGAPFGQFGWAQLDAGAHRVELELFYEGAGSLVELSAAAGTRSKLTDKFRLLGDLEQRPFGPVIDTDVGASMSGVKSSIYVRYPFQISRVADLEQLFLNVRYDDGLVAYLNGVEVVRRSAPFTLRPNSTATFTRADTAALTQEWIDISSFKYLLADGDNVLAIHGLNRAADNPDFLLAASLGAAIAADPLVITEPTLIKARAFRNGQWSPLREQLVRVAGPVRVTEVHYNPAAPTAAELAVNPGFERDDFEFIELKNTADQTLDISGLAFVQGVEFSFAESDVTTLEAGAFAVVVRNRAAFEARYGTAVPVAGQFAGNRLANQGETIRLEGLFGTEVHSFTYDNTGAWPARADGIGSSLEVLDSAGNYRDAGNWRASAEFGGSPGRDGAAPGADILVNELLATPAGSDPDRIELFNGADYAIDLAGWTLTNDPEQLSKFSLPAGTVLAPDSYLELTSSQIGFDLDGQNGDELLLVETDPESGAPVRFADHVLLAGADSGVALGRWPNGDPGGVLFPMTRPTFGAENGDPQVGDVVVSEIHYNPNQLDFQTDFSAGTADGFSELLGNWTVSDGFYGVLPGPEKDTAAVIPSLTGLPPDFVVSTKIRLPVSTDFKANAAIIFDYVDSTNFKFASVHGRTGRWRIGQRDAAKWNFLVTAERPLLPGRDLNVSVEITGSMATLLSNGVPQARYDFGVPLNGGLVGIGSRNGEAKFDNVAVEPLGDDTALEFVELVNTTAASIDLGGWQLRQAVSMTFTAGTELGPGEALVAVAFDPSDEVAAAAFRDRFDLPESVRLAGPFTGQLDDAGDVVQLVRPQLQDSASTAPVLVDTVAYLDQPPWPAAADGTSRALARSVPAAFGNFSASWAALEPTPGAAVFARLGDLNRDGMVTADDIADLVLALRQPAAYEAKHGVAAVFQADLDGDGDLDFDDISRFLALLDEPARPATAATQAAAAGGSARTVGADPSDRGDKRGPRH